MRFINLFEGFSSKYEKTKQFSSSSLSRSLVLVPIAMKEVLRIDDILKRSKTCSGKMELCYSIDTTTLDLYCRDYYLGSIYKAEDEWYYAYINWDYYKCDQLDGLLELLEKEFL